MEADDVPLHEGRGPFKRKLAYRVAFGLFLGVALVLLVAAVSNLRLQRQHLTSLISDSAERTAETVRRSTRDAMLRNSPDEVQRIITSVGAEAGFERIRIFDKQGRIKISTAPEEIGALVDKSTEQCFACHEQDRPRPSLSVADRQRTFRNAAGERVLAVLSPIRNEPACSTAACHAHGAGEDLLGILDVQLSLVPVDGLIKSSEKQLIFVLILTGVAVLMLSILLVWRIVLNPLNRLTRAMRTVAGGEMSTQIPVTSNDEIGELSASWNGMIGELNRAQGELEDWSHTLEAKVQEKTEELKEVHRRILVVEKMASLGKLAAVVAHEINNPLAGISTYARLLHRRLTGKPELTGPEKDDQTVEAARILELLDSEATRCGKIVRNLLLFSRTVGARFTKEELRKLVDSCVLLLHHQADLQGVEIRVEIPPDLPPVECDVTQMQQLLLTLAMNAVEAMPEGGVLTIGAHASQQSGEVVLTVADTGHGIAEEDLHKVFEPFYTTKEWGKGSGLGLAVAYGVAQRHHGRIHLESRLGAGTVFSVHLPFSQPEGAENHPEELQELLS